ncbi:MULTISPECIES: pyroglutamyl-peptidase I [Thermus]|jgi:pyroglutamyl-peptidase|uniref:Pyrrolidone-carboxylate peptidase n=1 Tax=Thermus brockianus TaxID=56956 RepID=A0A1J0LXD6_THEBO|nr:pyroglutamyl-peptidase I [Thermus brockianus]APD10275.1 pyrrolidone carboxyl peptidase [Thermus brockianus]BDG16441.1 pyrrolidone carboxyl peptidase [Thermus brockianus]
MVLLTGFEPFGGLRHNPSAALLSLLPRSIGEKPIQTALLPVDTGALPEALRALYARNPKAVLHLGLAENRPLITLERLAVNLLDFERPDNKGVLKEDEAVVPGGPLALPARFPVKEGVRRLREAGIPARASLSAGSYLCNQAFYLSLYHLPVSVPVAFVHLPPDETLALERGGPYVPLREQARAVEILLEML